MPVGVLALLAGRRLVPCGDRDRADTLAWPGLAWPGLTLISIGLPLIVLAATEFGTQMTLLDPMTGPPAVAGALALAGFVVRTARISHPLTDLGLFRSPLYASAGLATMFSGAVMFGFLLALPLFFQILRGASVVETAIR